MEIVEIFRRCEKGVSLFGVTLTELVSARAVATREIHRYEIDREIKNISKNHKPSTVSGVTNVHRRNRCPTKRDLR